MSTVERELKALNVGQKSYYHKAYIIETWGDNGEIKRMELKSYNTIVVVIDFHTDGVSVSIDSMYSKTTKRHIKDFILQMFRVTAWAKIEREYNQGVTLWEF